MTVQEKVRDIGRKLGEMSKEQPIRIKQHCYTLLRDAVVWTGPRIDSMTNESLLGFITLAATTVQSSAPELIDVRKSLQHLGFNVVPLN